MGTFNAYYISVLAVVLLAFVSCCDSSAVVMSKRTPSGDIDPESKRLAWLDRRVHIENCKLFGGSSDESTIVVSFYGLDAAFGHHHCRAHYSMVSCVRNRRRVQRRNAVRAGSEYGTCCESIWRYDKRTAFAVETFWGTGYQFEEGIRSLYSFQ